MATKLKTLLRPQRLRRVPAQFSWVDQRLVREGFIRCCDPPAAALYLFLLTVGDAQGLSFWGDAALCTELHLSPGQLGVARERLIRADLIAFQAPLYQVLSLPEALAPAALPATPKALDRARGREQLRRLLEQLGRPHD